jgi:hypothetical protein
MTRLFPLLIAAALLCCLIAYAREQARDAAEWQSTMDTIPRQMREAAW